MERTLIIVNESTGEALIITQRPKPSPRPKRPSLAAFLRAMPAEDREHFCLEQLALVNDTERCAVGWRPDGPKEYNQCARIIERCRRDRKTLLRHLGPEARRAAWAAICALPVNVAAHWRDGQATQATQATQEGEGGNV